MQLENRAGLTLHHALLCDYVPKQVKHALKSCGMLS